MADLSRYHEAQAGTYATALAELRGGHKTSHWMWFVFPLLRGLGRSATAQHFGIADLAEARAYLADPVLSARLTECAQALLSQSGRSAEAILGPVDAMKLRSSATLFRAVEGNDVSELMQSLLDRYFEGEPCSLTQTALAVS